MARKPRTVSEYGYYHLTLRGNSRQIIFEDQSDYAHFLNLLKKFSEEIGVTICAYCLMDNHVHLLICDTERNMPFFVQRLAGSYATWFNRKYQRTGHLFENRYYAGAIESNDALCSVFRYILNNPKEANICPAAEYPWSSYNKYGHPNSFVDTKVLQELLGSFKKYNDYLNAKDEEFDPVIPDHKRDDERAKELIRRTFNVESGTTLKSLDIKKRNEAIRLLREKGLSIRQIERLTGISKGAIQRACGTKGTGTGVPVSDD